MRFIVLIPVALVASLPAVALAACSDSDPSTRGLEPIHRILAVTSGGSAGAGDAVAGRAGAAGEADAGDGGASAGASSGRGGAAGSTAGASGDAGSDFGAGGASAGTAGRGEVGGFGGMAGAGTFPPTISGECPILARSDDGWVEGALNDCGVQGAWYAANDCGVSPEDCSVQELPEGDAFPNEENRLCTRGSTVVVATEAEFDAKWGANIGLNLNQPAGSTETNPIDSLPRELLGFRFILSGSDIPDTLRFNITTSATSQTPHFYPLQNGAGEYEVLFSDPVITQGDWVSPQVALDPSQVISIQFQVPSALNTAVAFDFCVENLRALF